MSVIQIAHNAVTAKLYHAPRDVKLRVSSLLSYQVNGFEHTTTFKAGHWDGRSTFFDFKLGTFPAGFVSVVHRALTKEGHDVQIVRKPLPAPRGPTNPKVDEFGNDPKYDYQGETVEKLLRYGQMIARVATGGGKSRIARMAYARIQRPTLFVTTRAVLMYQMKDAFETNLGVKAGVMGDGVWEPRKGFNVAMIQTLAAAMKDDKRRDYLIKLLSIFELVILEEAHEAGGESYYQIMQHCKSAHYRLSLTATPFMRGDSEDNMRLMACSGPIGIVISEKMLIDRGILAKPYFKYVKVEKPPKVFRTTSWQRAYKYGITENQQRNISIAKEALRAVKYGLPVMILVQRKDHGTILRDMIGKVIGKDQVQYIQGKDDQTARKSALKRLESGQYKVLIGTTILDVGVDVPAVGMVILAGGGKAEVALRQRIGRGLRAKKTGANVAFVVDFEDGINTHLAEHAQQRRAIVENTPGFAENILRKNVDFDFSSFGFRLQAA